MVVTAEGGGGYWHLVGRGLDAAEHPPVHRTRSPTESDLAPNASGAKAEKLCSGEAGLSLHALPLLSRRWR